MITPYLNFNGNTKEVIDFYENVFEATEKQIMTFKGMPDVPKEMENQVLHGRLVFAGHELLFSDAMSTDPVSMGNNVTLMVSTRNEDDLNRWFSKLSEEGTVYQDLQKTFFSERYGSLMDKYGIVWQFILEGKHQDQRH